MNDVKNHILFKPFSCFEQLDIEYIKNLVDSGGPEPEQYEELSSWFARFNVFSHAEQIPPEILKNLSILLVKQYLHKHYKAMH